MIGGRTTAEERGDWSSSFLLGVKRRGDVSLSCGRRCRGLKEGTSSVPVVLVARVLICLSAKGSEKKHKGDYEKKRAPKFEVRGERPVTEDIYWKLPPSI